MNLATLLEGPANVRHRGQLVHFKGGLTLTPLADLFPIESDLHGVLDRRALENSVVLTGTPIGVVTADMLAMLYRWQNPTIGQLVTPRYDVNTVTPATNIITLVGTAVPRTGCPLKIAAFPSSVLPAGLAAATLYYWGAAGTLHATEADAIAAANPVDITDAGTGDFAIIEQETIVIEAIAANRRITFHNGAVIGMPALGPSAVQTLFGQMSFGAFIKNNAAWSDANSLYTVDKVALADTAPNIGDIPTQEYSLAWGAAPWDAFKSRGPVTITPSLATDAIPTDGRGNVGLKISGLEVSAGFQPQGFSEAQMLDLLGMQGGTVARGKSRARGDLVVSGTGVHLTVYNATPRELPQTFQATGPRAGEVAAIGACEPGTGYFRAGVAAPV